MKSFISLIILAGLLNGGNGVANDYVEDCTETKVIINEVPFPRQSQIRIPWERMKGIWSANEFVIELGRVIEIKDKSVGSTPDRKRFIEVSISRVPNGPIVKRGAVYVRENGTRASGIVTDVSGESTGYQGLNPEQKDSFIIFRRFKGLDQAGNASSLYVVTLRDISSKTQICKETHYQMIRP